MSTARRMNIGMLAAGVFCLMQAGYVQAQQIQERRELTKPAQYADQDTGQPVWNTQNQSAQPAHNNRTEMQQAQPGVRPMRDADHGQRSTTYFRGPESEADLGTRSGIDHFLANCLLIKNKGEIEMNQFGEQRAKSDEVKEFARRMIEDHRALGDKLARLADNRDGTRSANAAGSNPALNRLLEIDRRIAERCGELTRQELESKSGAEFDWCFVGSQIGAHTQLLAALDVISNEAQGEVQQVAKDAKEKVKEHLEHAKELEKELAGNRHRDQS